MALHPDLSDPALVDALEDVRNESSPTKWYEWAQFPKHNSLYLILKYFA